MNNAEKNVETSFDIGLALSGGGVRAAVFHCGALLRLAKSDLLEHITRISTVSGGSLLTGLIFSLNDHRWPSSLQFRERVYPLIMERLTTTSLFSLKSVLQSPSQWPFLFFHRSKVLVKFLEKYWGVSGLLSDLPHKPVWIINTTCISTGKNWRFTKFEMGDWKFGRHYAPPFTICQAIAASAAVPYAIGGLNFTLPSTGWHKENPATSEPICEITPSLKRVTLWDGGAYENLGLEPLYKPDRSMIKCKDILIVDASASLNNGHSVSKYWKGFFTGNLTSPRLFDVTSDQIRSLRSRMFIDALMAGKATGALIKIGNTTKKIYDLSGNPDLPKGDNLFLSDEDVKKAKKHPTNLKRLIPSDFERLVRHGFECADATLTSYRKDLLSESLTWNKL
jgi:NTE family protein